MDKVTLENLKVARDEDDNVQIKYIDVDMGKVGIKPPTLGDMRRTEALADMKESDEAFDTLLQRIREMVYDPDLSQFSDEELLEEFEASQLIKLMRQINQAISIEVYGGEIKNPKKP